MNTPTPLGKQTFAEYTKAVDEYKFSQLTKTEKFEFKDVKTIEKLANQLYGVTELLDKGIDQVDTAVAIYNNAEDEKLERLKILEQEDEEHTKREKFVNEAKKDLADQTKIVEKEQKIYDKAFAKVGKAEDNVGKVNEKYLTNYSKGQKLEGQLKTAIKQVESAAKSLGISKVPATEIGQDAINEFDKNVPNAAKYLGY
jgi:ATP-dependent Clp protease ATP-binding subunit ClpA